MALTGLFDGYPEEQMLEGDIDLWQSTGDNTTLINNTDVHFSILPVEASSDATFLPDERFTLDSVLSSLEPCPPQISLRVLDPMDDFAVEAVVPPETIGTGMEINLDHSRLVSIIYPQAEESLQVGPQGPSIFHPVGTDSTDMVKQRYPPLSLTSIDH